MFLFIPVGNEGGWSDKGDGSEKGRSRPNEDDSNDGLENKEINYSGHNSFEDLRGWGV